MTDDEVKTSDKNITVKISSIKTQERKLNKSCLLHLFQTVFTSALFSVLFFLSQVKQSNVKRKEIEVKEVEAKYEINFSKKDFYKICVLVLVLRLAPKHLLGYNLRLFCSQIKIKMKQKCL